MTETIAVQGNINNYLNECVSNCPLFDTCTSLRLGCTRVHEEVGVLSSSTLLPVGNHVNNRKAQITLEAYNPDGSRANLNWPLRRVLLETVYTLPCQNRK